MACPISSLRLKITISGCNFQQCLIIHHPFIHSNPPLIIPHHECTFPAPGSGSSHNSPFFLLSEKLTFSSPLAYPLFLARVISLPSCFYFFIFFSNKFLTFILPHHFGIFPLLSSMLRHLIPFAFADFLAPNGLAFIFHGDYPASSSPIKWGLKIGQNVHERVTDRQTHSMAPAPFCLYPPHHSPLCPNGQSSQQETRPNNFVSFIPFPFISSSSHSLPFRQNSKKSLGLCENPRRRRQRNKSPPMGLRNKQLNLARGHREI